MKGFFSAYFVANSVSYFFSHISFFVFHLFVDTSSSRFVSSYHIVVSISLHLPFAFSEIIAIISSSVSCISLHGFGLLIPIGLFPF